MRTTAVALPIVGLVLAIGGCSSDGDGAPTPPTLATRAGQAGSTDGAPSERRFPDVIDAGARQVADTWTISATLSSPYDTPERYADAWRVLGPDGTVYAERVLLHDHADEQPFTRSESGIEIPDNVTEVVIEGRDLVFGYGGTTFTLVLRP